VRVDPALEQAWRIGGCTFEVFCRATRPGTPLDVDLDVAAGGVAMTDEPGVRAVLSMQVAMRPGLWDTLAPLGTRLVPVLRTRAGHSRWDTRFGVFEVEEQSLTYDGSGVLSVTAPDLWVRVRNRRLDRSVVANGNAVDIAVAYAREALGPDVPVTKIERSTVTVRGLVFEDDREELIDELLTLAGRVAYIDRDGGLVVERPRTLTGGGSAAWPVDPFHDGVLAVGTRSRSSAPVRNRIIVRSASGRYPQQTVQDANPSSPTRVSGPMGPRPLIVTTSRAQTATQANLVGRDVLRWSTATGAETTASTVPHYGLDPTDPVAVTFPAQGGDGWASERHLLASVDHPFPQRGQPATQSLTMRSTRPDGGEDIDEDTP